MKTQSKRQLRLLRELENNPLIERACKKANVGRSTYYGWCAADANFKAQAYEAQQRGRAKFNDFVESKLMENINDHHYPSIALWLRSNHDAYRPQVLRVVIEENKQQRIELADMQRMLEELVSLRGVDKLIEAAVSDPESFKKKLREDVEEHRKRMDRL